MSGRINWRAKLRWPLLNSLCGPEARTLCCYVWANVSKWEGKVTAPSHLICVLVIGPCSWATKTLKSPICAPAFAWFIILFKRVKNSLRKRALSRIGVCWNCRNCGMILCTVPVKKRRLSVYEIPAFQWQLRAVWGSKRRGAAVWMA